MRAEPNASPTSDRIRLLQVALCTLLAAVLASSLARFAKAEPPPPIQVSASATPKQVTIGDPIHYVVEISAATDTEVLIPVLAGQLGEFSITDFGELPPRRDNDRVVTGRWYTLTIFSSGDHLVPAPRVQYRIPGEGLEEATGNEVLIGVTSLLAQQPEAADIRDVKPPESVPIDWRPYLIIAAAFVLAGMLLGGLVYFLNRPRREYVVPPRPPHEVALAALQRLRAQHLTDVGQFEAFYVQLSAIVRTYLEDGFGLHAPEMTTEEFLSVVASDGRLIPAHRRLLASFLSEADLVKFARHVPTLRDSESAYEAARLFVEETQPRTSLPPAAELNDAAA
jgi:hypothetical protein